jgi:hypothetical protein
MFGLNGWCGVVLGWIGLVDDVYESGTWILFFWF